jgi:hypothetical protein
LPLSEPESGADGQFLLNAGSGEWFMKYSGYVGALWALGLSDDLKIVADPDRDTEGKTLERARAPKTASKRQKAIDNDF